MGEKTLLFSDYSISTLFSPYGVDTPHEQLHGALGNIGATITAKGEEQRPYSLLKDWDPLKNLPNWLPLLILENSGLTRSPYTV